MRLRRHIAHLAPVGGLGDSEQAGARGDGAFVEGFAHLFEDRRAELPDAPAGDLGGTDGRRELHIAPEAAHLGERLVVRGAYPVAGKYELVVVDVPRLSSADGLVVVVVA